LATARVRSQVERGAGTAKWCFALLDKLLSFRNEPFPSGDELYELRVQLLDLIDSVMRADVNPALASFLLRELHDLAGAIDEFYVSGKAPARAVFARIVGDVQMSTLSVDEKDQGLVKRFTSFLGSYAAVFNFGTAAAQLTTEIMLALPPGHH
jgi:hypothetical protein